MTRNLSFGNVVSTVFGLSAFSIGMVNIFWGNDSEFGIFIVLLSLVYFIPVDRYIKEKLGLTIPKFGLLKVLLALLILWASLGVGELANKLTLMLNSF